VLVLARHFLTKIAGRTGRPVTGISGEAAAKLVAYDWPGNVRELENCMERVVALCRGAEVTIDDLPTKVKDHQSTRMMVSTDAPDELVTLEEMERRYVRQVVHATSGNKTFAARVLGIDRRSLYRRLAQAAATDDKR
jgi:two-component system response regulator HydG